MSFEKPTTSTPDASETEIPKAPERMQEWQTLAAKHAAEAAQYPTGAALMDMVHRQQQEVIDLHIRQQKEKTGEN